MDIVEIILKHILKNNGSVDTDELFNLCDTSTLTEIVCKNDKFVSCICNGQPKLVVRSRVRLCWTKDCQGCGSLHVCRGFLTGSCQYNQTRRGCTFSHDLHSDYNEQILQEFGLETLTRTELCVLLLQSNNTLLPSICFNYNNGTCCQDDCKGMHICERFFSRDCSCFRTHDFYAPQPLKCLQEKHIPDNIIKTLRTVYANKQALRNADKNKKQNSQLDSGDNVNSGNKSDVSSDASTTQNKTSNRGGGRRRRANRGKRGGGRGNRGNKQQEGACSHGDANDGSQNQDNTEDGYNSDASSNCSTEQSQNVISGGCRGSHGGQGKRGHVGYRGRGSRGGRGNRGSKQQEGACSHSDLLADISNEYEANDGSQKQDNTEDGYNSDASSNFITEQSQNGDHAGRGKRGNAGYRGRGSTGGGGNKIGDNWGNWSSNVDGLFSDLFADFDQKFERFTTEETRNDGYDSDASSNFSTDQSKNVRRGGSHGGRGKRGNAGYRGRGSRGNKQERKLSQSETFGATSTDDLEPNINTNNEASISQDAANRKMQKKPCQQTSPISSKPASVDRSSDERPRRAPRDKTEICMFFIKGHCIHEDRCFKVHDKMPYRWEIKKDGKWTPMAENEKIEKDYCDPGNTYSTTSPPVHFDTMTCGNDEVRRLSTMNSVEQPDYLHTTEWLWYWEDEYGKWYQYAAVTSEHRLASITSRDLEEMYVKNDKDVVQFTAGSQTYELSCQDMIQTNLKYSTKRLVRRRPKFVSAADVLTKRKRPVNSTAVPDYWDKTQILQTGFKRVALQDSSGEYMEIRDLFRQTMSGFDILKIERIQNKSVWEAFQLQKNHMRNSNGGRPVTEKKLFHGTYPKFVDTICATNFDWRVCGVNGTVFGQGSYFARDAKYSHDYTGDTDVRFMFVSRVLVGDYTKGSSEYRRPPSKDGGDVNLYDSCVNDVFNPSIFVVFEKQQIYPEYLLQYKDRGRSNVYSNTQWASTTTRQTAYNPQPTTYYSHTPPPPRSFTPPPTNNQNSCVIA